jgi:excisionase family DNA binding protein
MKTADHDDDLDLDLMLTASEVAKLFRVSVKTVGRWGRSGALPLRRTVGGHHRYRAADVRDFLGLDSKTPLIDEGAA